MLFISILILIVAMALHSNYIHSILVTRIAAIIFIYAGALSFNAFYIQSIGSGIGIYSGLFHVTTVSQLLDTFIFLIGSLILIAWPSVLKSTTSNESGVPAVPAGAVVRDLDIKGPRFNTAAEYSLVVLFSTLGASLLVSSADLISMYLSIELQSFGVYILSTLYRDSESSTSAGLKYFLLGGLSSCLILLGAGLIYSYTGLTNFESIYSLVSVSESQSIILPFPPRGAGVGLSLGLIIIIIGFLFKIAAAPLHNWSPDVYDDTPTIVTIWLTIMPKISIIIFLLEIQSQIGIIENTVSVSSITNVLESVSSVQTQFNTSYILKNLLLISSLLSLIIGTVVGLAQSRIKRLLSYSTISHIGFILLALAINSEQSIDSLIFYIMQYSITNLNTFLIILAIGYIHALPFTNPTVPFYNESGSQGTTNENQGSQGEKGVGAKNTTSSWVSVKGYKGSETDIKFISELKGQFFSNPLLSISLTICLFSMAGIPPLMGFFAKQFVLYSAIQSGYYFMAIVGIIVSVISASYYLKIIKVLHSTPLDPSLPISNESTANSIPDPLVPFSNENEAGATMITNFHSFLISTLTLSIFFFVLKPSLLLNSTQLLSLSLFYY